MCASRSLAGPKNARKHRICPRQQRAWGLLKRPSESSRVDRGFLYGRKQIPAQLVYHHVCRDVLDLGGSYEGSTNYLAGVGFCFLFVDLAARGAPRLGQSNGALVGQPGEGFGSRSTGYVSALEILISSPFLPSSAGVRQP